MRLGVNVNMNKQTRSRATLYIAAVLISAVLGVRTWSALAQSGPSASAAAAALAGDAHGFLDDLASQRDAIGGWPTNVQANFTSLTQMVSDLDAAVSANDRTLVRKRYQGCVRLAARISRWLVNHYDPANDQAPSADRVDAVISRLTDRLALIQQLANKAQVTLNLNAVNTARQQVDAARGMGMAQLGTAVRSLRDAIDNLQDSLPDPTN